MSGFINPGLACSVPRGQGPDWEKEVYKLWGCTLHASWKSLSISSSLSLQGSFFVLTTNMGTTKKYLSLLTSLILLTARSWPSPGETGSLLGKWGRGGISCWNLGHCQGLTEFLRRLPRKRENYKKKGAKKSGAPFQYEIESSWDGSSPTVRTISTPVGDGRWGWG